MLVLFATQGGMRETEIRTLGAWCFHLLQNNSQNCLLLENIYIVGAVIYDLPKHVDIYYLSIWCNLPRNASDCWWHIEWRISVVDDTSNGHCLINSCILQLKVTIHCYYSSVNKASLDVTSRRIYRDSHQTFFNFINYHLGIRDMKYHR